MEDFLFWNIKTRQCKKLLLQNSLSLLAQGFACLSNVYFPHLIHLHETETLASNVSLRN